MIFLPKQCTHRLRPPQERWCHWCASGPHHVSELTHVMEGPMRWWFCCDGCCEVWQERRHDRDVLEWLKEPAGTRAKVLATPQDAPSTLTASCRRRLAGLCSDSRVALSVPEDA